MNDGTRSSFAALALVLGLTLTVLGGILFVTSRPVSQDEAIQRAARRVKGPQGEKMYQITDGEIRQAMSQRQTTNTGRETRRQIGGVMAVAGIVLLGAGGLAARAPVTGNARKPDQP
jgi:hypothetical protein